MLKTNKPIRGFDAVLDEIPSSYKNIDEVMENQTSLVSVVHVLKQVMCIKGG